MDIKNQTITISRRKNISVMPRDLSNQHRHHTTAQFTQTDWITLLQLLVGSRELQQQAEPTNSQQPPADNSNEDAYKIQLGPSSLLALLNVTKIILSLFCQMEIIKVIYRKFTILTGNTRKANERTTE